MYRVVELTTTPVPPAREQQMIALWQSCNRWDVLANLAYAQALAGDVGGCSRDVAAHPGGEP